MCVYLYTVYKIIIHRAPTYIM